MNLATAHKLATRDSATALLRRLGVAREDYNDYICRRDGAFYVDVLGASAETAKAAAPQAPLQAASADVSHAAPAAAREQAPKPATAGPNGSISATARAAILAGLDNAAVWAELVKHHQLPPSRRGYPAWYRCELRRKGHNV